MGSVIPRPVTPKVHYSHKNLRQKNPFSRGPILPRSKTPIQNFQKGPLFPRLKYSQVSLLPRPNTPIPRTPRANYSQGSTLPFHGSNGPWEYWGVAKELNGMVCPMFNTKHYWECKCLVGSHFPPISSQELPKPGYESITDVSLSNRNWSLTKNTC